MATTTPTGEESTGTTTRQRLPDHVDESLCTDQYGRPDGYAYTCTECGLTVPAREKDVLVGCCE